MTSAHRPTFTPALGNAKTLTESYSARNSTVVPMKTRQPGQAPKDEVNHKDFKEELQKKEQEVQNKLKKTAKPGVHAVEAPHEEEPPAKRPKLLDQVNSKLDADDTDDEEDDEEEEKKEDDEEDEDDDDDDEAELLRELEKIKRERAMEQEKKAREEATEQEQIRTEQVLTGNPLLAGDFSLKKKWYDDVVFKNCAKKDDKESKKFVNDIIRSDFHRKFMNKYVR